MKTGGRRNTAAIAIVGSLIVAAILVLGTIWTGQRAQRDTAEAVRTVSVLYLDELAGRREQVVQNNLLGHIEDMRIALELMSGEDLSDAEHLCAYQARMKRIYNLEKFAFVDTDGVIYTSMGTQTNIRDYRFDYRTIAQPEVSILNLNDPEKKVVIALPVELSFEDRTFCVCFMEIDMKVMLAGVSMGSQTGEEATFCNIYTNDGVALSNTVLGGLSMDDNLLAAMKNAEFEKGYSYESFLESFQSCSRGEVSFTYKGIRETLSYVPVDGTNWLLTYLVRESVIGEKIDSISDGFILRSILQSVLIVAALIGMFVFIIAQTKKSSRLLLARETAEAEVRGKEEELEQRIVLQEKLEQQSKALSEALTAAEQANKAKTVFLSNMSHEIRTPMNAIIGLDSIALNDPETPEKTRGYLEKIGASADHLLKLINDILDMSRIESGRMALKNEEFSFPELLRTVNTMFSGQAAEKGIDYQCNIRGEVDDCYIGDSVKLRQILINILGNAVKFTPAGGSVTLLVERKAQYDGKSTLCFTVSDTGIGMSEEFLPHIFDSFAQEDGAAANQYGSSGLGLAITKNIVEMMNGEIRVESVKDKGSVFTVTVTLGDSDRSGAEEAEESVLPEEMSILIIDDDPVACEHARLVLEKAGIAAETALSGREGIEMVRLRQARMQPYNLILVDWKMPEMDGVETTRQIRAIVGSESAIIILTAYRWDDVLEEAIRSGVDSFIPKPLFAATVLEEFRSAVKKRGAGARRPGGKAELSGRRILLAEDVEINAEIISMLLQAREMEPDLAENGKVAVEKFASHEPGYYSAVLMDMRMPEMDGLKATQTIRAMDRPDAARIPIIALTANAFDEDVQRSMQAGLNAHLSKPVQPETLYETLENLIRG